jgi:hypothetical protein
MEGEDRPLGNWREVESGEKAGGWGVAAGGRGA